MLNGFAMSCQRPTVKKAARALNRLQNHLVAKLAVLSLQARAHLGCRSLGATSSVHKLSSTGCSDVDSRSGLLQVLHTNAQRLHEGFLPLSMAWAADTSTPSLCQWLH